MIPLEEFRVSLGEKLLKELSEEQIKKLWEQDDQMAEIMFQLWLEDKGTK